MKENQRKSPLTNSPLKSHPHSCLEEDITSWSELCLTKSCYQVVRLTFFLNPGWKSINPMSTAFKKLLLNSLTKNELKMLGIPTTSSFAPTQPRDLEKARAEFQIQHMQNPTSIVPFKELLKIQAENNEIEEAKDLISRVLPKKGLFPSIFLYNCLLQSINEYEKAQELFKEIHFLTTVKPNEFTYLIMMDIAGKHGDASTVESLYEKIKNSNTMRAENLQTVILVLAENGKEFKHVLADLIEMSRKGNSNLGRGFAYLILKHLAKQEDADPKMMYDLYNLGGVSFFCTYFV